MDDPIVVYADELQTDDDIQFDNRDSFIYSKRNLIMIPILRKVG